MSISKIFALGAMIALPTQIMAEPQDIAEADAEKLSAYQTMALDYPSAPIDFVYLASGEQNRYAGHVDSVAELAPIQVFEMGNGGEYEIVDVDTFSQDMDEHGIFHAAVIDLYDPARNKNIEVILECSLVNSGETADVLQRAIANYAVSDEITFSTIDDFCPGKEDSSFKNNAQIKFFNIMNPQAARIATRLDEDYEIITEGQPYDVPPTESDYFVSIDTELTAS